MKGSVRLSAFDEIKVSPFDFARKSSVGCGGVASVAYYPRSVEEMALLVRTLEGEGIPYVVLGNMTNVLPPEGRMEKIVLSTKGLRGVQTGEKLFAYAGVGSGELLAAARREKMEGVEFLYGIPCTLGGALYMNAGAGGAYIAELVERVLVLRKGKLEFLPVSECGYAYKTSIFMKNEDIILGGELRLKTGSLEGIEERIFYYKNKRAHLPTEPSMGCIFKNPTGGFAGDWIERSGLKGMRIGGARVSPKHANFIVNEGNATPTDIRALIVLIKNAVRAQYGIELEEEIRYLE